MRVSLILSLITSPLLAVPASSPLTLVEGDPNFNRLALTISPPSPLPSRTDTSILTSVPGQPVTATLDVDPDAGSTTELSVSGGRMTGSDTSFSANIFIASYSINVTNLGGHLFTPAPPAPVDPSNGEFDASLHQFEIDQGSASGSVSTLVTGSTPIDLTFSPESSVSGNGSGTGMVTLTQTDDGPLSKTFLVTVVLPVDITEVTDADGQEVTVRAVGTLKLQGTTEVYLTDYIAWTVANGIDGAPGDEDINGDGVPNGIAWALGYDGTADASASLPRPSTTTPGGFDLILPDGGTAAPLVSERSTNLTGWTDIDALRLTNGANPIPAGTTGTITIAPSAGPREFIRLQSSE